MTSPWRAVLWNTSLPKFPTSAPDRTDYTGTFQGKMPFTMKIMTLNLNFCESQHGRWPARRELIAQAIRQHGPDIIAFQAVRKDPASEDGKDQAAQPSST